MPAIEYQGLHSDNVWTEPHDPTGRVSTRDAGAGRDDQLPDGRPHAREQADPTDPRHAELEGPIPNLADEPEWMKLSTLCPAPAGSGIFRDLRCWHGGTPNLSHEVRAAPNVEYFAPWFRSEAVIRSMPYEQWKRLSPHGQRISRYVMCGEGETVIGAGYIIHGRSA
jgi:hypothetical protein